MQAVGLMQSPDQTDAERLVRDDRTLAALLLSLSGNLQAKAGIVRALACSRPADEQRRKTITTGSAGSTPANLIESDMIQYALDEMGTGRATVLLLSLVERRENGHAVRKIILRYLFDRDIEVVKTIAVRHRDRVRKLLRHCYSPKVIANLGIGVGRPWWIGSQEEEKRKLLRQLFDGGQVDGDGSMRGARKTLYGLYWSFMRGIEKGDPKGWEWRWEGIQRLMTIKTDLHMGRVGLVLDCRDTSQPGDERPWHRFLVGMCVASVIEGVVSVAYAAGKWVPGHVEGQKVCFPAGRVDQLAAAIDETASKGASMIVLVSDGTGNVGREKLETAWAAFKVKTPEARILHLQPVSDGDWTLRPLVEEATPLLVAQPDYFRTAMILRGLRLDPTSAVPRLMVEYRKAVGQMRGEIDFLLT